MRRSYAAYAAGAVAAAVSAVLAAPGGTVGGSAALRHGSQVAWLKESSVALHPAPGSPQVSATIASRTEFGSRTSLPVVAAGRGWLKVISANLRNGVYGYVRRWHVQVTWDPVAIDVDLSGRLLRVWRRGTVVLRAAVGIGAAGTPTRSAALARPTSSPASIRPPTAAASSRCRPIRTTCRRAGPVGTGLRSTAAAESAPRRRTAAFMRPSPSCAA